MSDNPGDQIIAERIARRERIAELIAKREATRGRPLTASEQIENFAAAMAEDAANQEGG